MLSRFLFVFVKKTRYPSLFHVCDYSVACLSSCKARFLRIKSSQYTNYSCSYNFMSPHVVHMHFKMCLLLYKQYIWMFNVIFAYALVVNFLPGNVLY